MITPFTLMSHELDCPTSVISSVNGCNDGVFAATFDQGVYRKQEDGLWERHNEGLPDGTIINRFALIEHKLYACSNKGLFYYGAKEWRSTAINFPCYQIVKQGEALMAATEYGIWCRVQTSWHNLAYSNCIVFDLLLAPHYYFLGFSGGIAMYDLYTDTWAEFLLPDAVSSLAVIEGHLLGVTSRGDLMQGNRKGGFVRIGFEGMTFYSLKPAENGLFACTSKGLYRLLMKSGRLMLQGIVTGYSVTDMNVSGDSLYLATLYHGLKKAVL